MHIKNDDPNFLHRLRETLTYDPITGLFKWLIATGRRAKIGDVAGSVQRKYIHIRVDGQAYAAHRLAWLFVMGVWPDGELDHVDGDGTNNRWSNIRPATRVEQMRNAAVRYDSTSGYKGVSWHKAGNCWRAYITVEGRTIALGLYRDKENAIAARKAAEAKYFGEFSRGEK